MFRFASFARLVLLIEIPDSTFSAIHTIGKVVSSSMAVKVDEWKGLRPHRDGCILT